MTSKKSSWYNTGGTVKAGDAAEEAFKKVAENLGWEVIKASPEQNKKEHWDFLIKSDSMHSVAESFTVDVKARKKLARTDAEVNDNWIYVEFVVDRGYPGWLYSKTTNLIAFETEHEFLVVEREDLRILAECVVDRNTFVTDPHEAKYKVFNRRDKEEVALIESDMVRSIAKWVWKKNFKSWAESLDGC